MDEREAYAIAYYFGRAIGSEEALLTEQPDLFDHGPLQQAAKDGYDRGVSDFVRFDEGKA